MSKLILFGAGGQLGSNILNNFISKNNLNIVAVDKQFQNKLNSKNITYIEKDLGKESLEFLKKYFEKNTVIINCVGLQHSLMSRKIYNTNFNLNKEIFDYIYLNFTGFHYIYISSLSVRKDSNNLPNIGKGSPINIYGTAKLNMEKYLNSKANKDNSITILRPAAFYSQVLSKNLENFFDLIINKIFFLPIKSINRSFLNLDYFINLLYEYIIHLDDQKSNDIYIYDVGDTNTVDFFSLLEYFKKEGINIKSKIIRMPKLFFIIIGKFGYLIEKIGIHINILSVIGEFGYDYVAYNDREFVLDFESDTYKNFSKLAKKVETN